MSEQFNAAVLAAIELEVTPLKAQLGDLQAALREAQEEREAFYARESGQAVLMHEHYRGTKQCPDATDSCWGCTLRLAEAELAEAQRAQARGKAARQKTLSDLIILSDGDVAHYGLAVSAMIQDIQASIPTTGWPDVVVQAMRLLDEAPVALFSSRNIPDKREKWFRRYMDWHTRVRTTLAELGAGARPAEPAEPPRPKA